MKWSGTDSRTHLAQRMRVWRAHWDLTQAQAAAAAGVSLSSWSRWERGRGTPTFREWQRIIALMDRADAPAIQHALEWGH
jgi:DNA-binding XRE family transcriptional regulator